MAIKIRERLTSNREKDIERLTAELLKLPPDQEYKIFVFDQKKPRTLPQNAYYWGVVLKYISEDTGNSPEPLHEYFKKKFNAAAVVLNGNVEVVPGSTTGMDRKDFGQYVDEIKLWALDFLNIRIPDPQEVPDSVYVEMIENGLIK